MFKNHFHTNFDIVDISTVSVEKLALLAEPSLGKGYLSTDYFKNINKSSRYEGKAVICKGELVAFLVYYFTNKNDVVEKLNDLALLQDLDNEIICLDTMVVNPKYRMQGVGKELIEVTINKYNKRFGFLMYAWSQQGKINMKRIADDFLFEQKGEYTELWKEDCEKGCFICPAKKNKVCICSTVLFYRKLF